MVNDIEDELEISENLIQEEDLLEDVPVYKTTEPEILRTTYRYLEVIMTIL